MGVIVPSGSASVKVNHGFTVSVSENRYNKYGIPTADFLFSTGTLENAITNVNPITFNRNSIGTYVDANGVIQTAASNEARFDHDPVTGESLGLLVEEGRTNLLQYSQEFNASYWTNGTVTVIPNTALAPDNTFTASKLVPNTSSDSTHRIRKSLGTVSGSGTLSIFLKKSEYSKAILVSADTNSQIVVDLNSGAILSSGVNILSSSVTQHPNGWWRASRSVGSGLYRYFNVYGVPDSITAYSQAFAGDGTSGIYIWAAQIEAGSFPTSYIPTPATFISRASTATYYDSNGVVQTAAIDEARDDAYFPDENGVMTSAGLLLEGAETNDNPHSEHVNLYSTTELTTRENQELAPDLSFTAGTIIETTANSYHKLFLNPTPATGNLTLSAFIKNK